MTYNRGMDLDKKLIEQVDIILKELFPICRSISGSGLRETLSYLNKITSFDIKSFESESKYYDWQMPKEWKINDAFIKDSKGNRVVDFKESNLHVVNYSIPVDGLFSYKELKKKIHTLPDLPNAIPYRTTYYNDDWGFCMTHNAFKMLDTEMHYEVKIDSKLECGEINYGEIFLQGENKKEIIITTYPCHPSLANDNLSGVVLWILLLRELKKKNLRNNYTFVIHPETIGAIGYIATNEEKILKLDGGFVLSTVAGPGAFGVKKTFQEDSFLDKAIELSLKERSLDFLNYPFDPDAGSDERQYSSPYFKIPMTSICKDKYFEYDYYHTSLDNLEFIAAKYLLETMDLYLDVIDKIENDKILISLNQKCEPMLGKRDLYPKVGGQLKQNKNIKTEWDVKLKAINWLMYLCDGKTSLIDISKQTNIDFNILVETAEQLSDKNLLKEVD